MRIRFAGFITIFVLIATLGSGQGIITTVAGRASCNANDEGGPATSDGGPAANAFIGRPDDLVLDAAGNMYVDALTQNTRVRKIAAPPAYVCTNTAAPTITSVDSASAYGGYPYFASGSWLEIKGTNLADPSDPRLKAANPGQWTDAGVHLFFLDKPAALGCRDSSFDGCKEPGLVIQITEKNILHQSLGVGPGFGGCLR